MEKKKKQKMKTILFFTLLTFSLVSTNSDIYGDVHKEAHDFRKQIFKSHKPEEHIGDFKAEDLSKDKKEDDIYYWFSLHDYNRDGHLDGHELRAAWMQSDPNTYTLQKAEELVDKILDQDDADADGKISWQEYLASVSK